LHFLQRAYFTPWAQQIAASDPFQGRHPRELLRL